MEKLTILLVGSGGREHALAWKIAQSPLCGRLVAAPGNPGIEQVAEVRALKVTDVEGLVTLAQEIAADLVVVGPESALEVGLADRLGEVGIPCFGGSAQAARLETSKAFTKDFCARHGLPTAAYGVFTDAAVLDMLGGRFGSAGARVVIEEFMHGEEASLFAICDGKTAVLFGAAQDHKRAYDGDTGPNTGGMGTYSPPPVLTDALVEQAWRELVVPTIEGMAAEGCPYVGVLYAGLMLTESGPKLVEYNARFGDPECQTLMLRLESDLVPLLLAAAKGELASAAAPVWRDEAAICVVLAAEGYPDAPKTGGLIQGADSEFGGEAVIFHAGTTRDADGRLVASGGRVLNVCALGATLHEARDVAYAALGTVSLEGGFYRTDIGWRALSQHG